MGPVKRPVGVTVLSLVAFAASPFSLAILGRLCYLTITSNYELAPSSAGPDVFIRFWVLSTLGFFSLLALSWISLRAGLDLWRLKNRGRLLALVSMILYFLVGMLFLLAGLLGRDKWFTSIGALICSFSLFHFVYLLLPSTRRKFEASLTEPA